MKNGYLGNHIDRVVNNFLSKIFVQNSVSTEHSDFINLLPLQFRGNHSTVFAKQIHKLLPTTRIYFTTTKLRSIISPTSLKVPVLYKSGVVYKYTCPTCHKLYIGQTKRYLSKRINEHFAGDLYQHHINCNNINSISSFKDCFTILDKHSYYKDLQILEIIYITKLKPLLNTQVNSKKNNYVLCLALF